MRHDRQRIFKDDTVRKTCLGEYGKGVRNLLSGVKADRYTYSRYLYRRIDGKNFARTGLEATKHEIYRHTLSNS